MQFLILESFLLSWCYTAISSPKVVPTEAPSQPLSTVDNFPDTEVLNRNKDDIEKRKQVGRIKTIHLY